MIVASYPNNKPAPELLGMLVEHLQTYELGQLDRLVNPQTGIQTTSIFPPSIAEIVAWFKAREFVAPRQGHGPNLTGSAEPDQRKLQTLEERKAFVIRELGYDPLMGRPSDRPFKPRSLDELAALPPARPSRELIEDQLRHAEELERAKEATAKEQPT